MKKLKRAINNSNVSRFRLIIQIIAFIALIYGGTRAISIGERAPTFACPYNMNSGGTCYLISIQHQFHISITDFAGWRGISVLTGLFGFLLLFIILNKSWCGFICPLGFLQDLMTKFRTLFHIRFSRYDEGAFRFLKNVKYIVLVLMLLIPLGISNSLPGLGKLPEDMSAPFCQLCPGRTITPALNADFSQFFIDFSNPTTIIMSTLAMLIISVFFVGSFVKKRFFCFFCPMSALQHLFSRLGLLRLVKSGEKCTRCGNCSRVCDMGIPEIAEDVKSRFIVKDDCMMCFKCLEACPENECLKVTFAGLKIINSTEEGFFKRYAENPTYSINEKNLTETNNNDRTK